MGAVRALLRKILETRHYEREALAVDDMPVEHIKLRNRFPASDRTRHAIEDK